MISTFMNVFIITAVVGMPHLMAVNYGKTTCLQIFYPNLQHKCDYTWELYLIISMRRKGQFRERPQDPIHISRNQQIWVRMPV